MEYRLEIGIVDSGVLSDNFIEFYYSELQISGRVFDSSIGYTILIDRNLLKPIEHTFFRE